MSRLRTRRGITLLEIVVALAILALLFALLMSAVQKVRVAAVRAESENNLRQIGFAMHQLAGQQLQPVGGLAQANMPPKSLYTEQSLFFALVPFVHGRNPIPPNATPAQMQEFFNPKVKVYISPGDPTLDVNPALVNCQGKCSYVYNILAVEGVLNLPFAIPDGTSTTIAFAEHYFYSKKTEMILDFTDMEMPTSPKEGATRRATFADKPWRDVMPMKDPATGKTLASVPGRTFQVRPTPEEADGYTPQTPFAAGLPVAMFDGSVRTLSPRIDESVFWSLVTPNGGEVIGD